GAGGREGHRRRTSSGRRRSWPLPRPGRPARRGRCGGGPAGAPAHRRPLLRSSRSERALTMQTSGCSRLLAALALANGALAVVTCGRLNYDLLPEPQGDGGLDSVGTGGSPIVGSGGATGTG